MKNSYSLLMGTFLLFIFITSCAPTSKVLWYNVPSVKDAKLFPQITLEASPNAAWPFVEKQNWQVPTLEKWVGKKGAGYDNFESFLEATNTTAFIVIRNDSVLYENYFNGLSNEEPDIVFSLNKVFITSLLDIAIKEGYIKNLKQKVSDFIPSFKQGGKSKVTIENVLDMNSGLNHDDYQKLFSSGLLYYNSNLDKLIDKAKAEYEAGQAFTYKSMDTQILGRCIEIATGRDIIDYIQEKIWNPLGMEYPAYFTRDREDGDERMFGGLEVSSRDLVKLGKLFLDDGKWNGESIIRSSWIKDIRNRKLEKGKWYGYKYGWWRDTQFDQHFLDSEDFFGAGYKGQFLYISPENNTIILRQGSNKGGITWSPTLGKLSDLLGGNGNYNHVSVSADNPGDLLGKYVVDDERYFKVNKNENGRWWIELFENEKRKKKIKLKTFCSKSLFSLKHFLRVIFDVDGEQVKGIYWDTWELGSPEYYEKVE